MGLIAQALLEPGRLTIEANPQTPDFRLIIVLFVAALILGMILGRIKRRFRRRERETLERAVLGLSGYWATNRIFRSGAWGRRRDKRRGRGY